MTARAIKNIGKLSATILVAGSVAVSSACSRDVDAMTPQQLQQLYGITDAYTGQVATSDGAITGTLVPVTLPDGRRAELFIPAGRSEQPHQVYFRDEAGLYPVALQPNVPRQQVVSSPVVVERRAEPEHPRKRSWEKELMIIGGSAGAGAAVGALAGGKKGAAIGAGAGGLGGLIYDLATRED